MLINTLDQKVDDFIRNLGVQSGTKVARMIELLKQFGSNLSMPYSKKVSNNLFELRIRGRQEVRIFYTFYHNKAVLLHGFIKKTQKTPTHELEIAQLKLKKLTQT